MGVNQPLSGYQVGGCFRPKAVLGIRTVNEAALEGGFVIFRISGDYFFFALPRRDVHQAPSVYWSQV